MMSAQYHSNKAKPSFKQTEYQQVTAPVKQEIPKPAGLRVHNRDLAISGEVLAWTNHGGYAVAVVRLQDNRIEIWPVTNSLTVKE
jgi:hypothetical protein